MPTVSLSVYPSHVLKPLPRLKTPSSLVSYRDLSDIRLQNRGDRDSLRRTISRFSVLMIKYTKGKSEVKSACQ